MPIRSLSHNGVLVPPKYKAHELSLGIGSVRIPLKPNQEEMAVAWVKKLGTEYADDEVFVRNFFRDFSDRLGIGLTKPSQVDFSEVIQLVQDERENRAAMPRVERQALAEERKVIRERNKERFGYAEVDGIRMEIGNYIAEPSSIFMGRGKHPSRGKWKEGPEEKDIELNLSPDSLTPPGAWGSVSWHSDSFWVARWKDKLSGKIKYVWLSDFAVVKQQKEKEKFDLAASLEQYLQDVRNHIQLNLESTSVVRRRIATVCYLVDMLMFRVGDEENEAGTVGASTLRPEHIKFGQENSVTFDFLGKDSIRFSKSVQLPLAVVRNLESFARETRSTVFRGVRSKPVSDFLGEMMPGLTAKVFRTYHATSAVEAYFKANPVNTSEPDYVKRHVATMANLQAASLCNHKRKIPKTWEISLQRKEQRLERLGNKEGKSEKNLTTARSLMMRISESKATKDYNLRTSLKSYIDPRTYYEWGLRVDYDWKKYYPSALQRKFSWIEL